jgi:hypothetical protein
MMDSITRRDFGRILAASAVAAPAARKTRNVIFVMVDGLRWQEVFAGADAALMTKENGVSDPDAFKREYWRETAEARRETLLPFLWKEMVPKGQIFGNRAEGSPMFVTNGLNFSYPGYSETLCGVADPRVDSNDKIPNPNLNVLEWLNKKPAWRGKVAAFGAWDLFPFILNAARSGMLVNAGYDPLTAPPVTSRIQFLNRLKVESKFWDGEPLDVFTFHTALEYLKLHTPRVLFLSLGETDEWAHDGRYPAYMRAARRSDQFLKEIWTTAQSIPQYRATTTLLFACDHGRGDAPVEWKSHGRKIPASKYTWLACMGPDTPPLGERRNTEAVTQNRIAATLAALLGENYLAGVPDAGPPIAALLPK